MATSRNVSNFENEESRFNYIIKFLKPRALTSCNIITWYTPAVGSISYSLFSLHIFNPSFLESLFPRSRYMIANTLLFNSHLGAIFYLSNSKHLVSSSIQHRALYGIYGALLFNFGSVLLWAVTKSILPEDGFIRTAFSLSSSACMLFIGREYIHYIDSLCSKND